MFGWFRALSLGRKLAVGLIASSTIGVAGAAIAPPPTQAPVSTPSSQSTSDPTVVQGDKVEVKTITETQSIPYESITKNDASLTSGKSVVMVTGVNGIKTVTYRVTYTSNKETSREKTSEVVTIPPVTQVTDIGTKAYAPPAVNCPNGTYVNTAGNVVCSPYNAPSTPSGATARCGDGTYSFSQSRSGTCSHHGGVAEWL